MYRLKKFENGFEYIEVQNESASVKIALQGAHIFEYVKKDAINLLWLSEFSAFEEGIAIRGGIPLCWPRFGSLDKTLPQHGFARTELFKLMEVKEIDASTTEIVLGLKDTPSTRQIWNHKFDLQVKIRVAEKLTLIMSTKNLDEEEFMLTQAFHSYFRISDINNIAIKGLEEKAYYDSLLDCKGKESQSLLIDKEVDRVYQETDSKIFLEDNEKIITLKTSGSSSSIVWNPWIDKCSRMSYMSKNAYKSFVCIESANAFDDSVIIKSKKTHTLSLDISF